MDRILREVLLDSGASHDDAATVIANMGAFLDLLNLDFTFSFPAPIFAAVDQQFNEFFLTLQQRTHRLIFERVKMELNNLGATGTG